MSPQYTSTRSTHSKSPFSVMKARQMYPQKTPTFRDLDRALARAYVEMQRERIQRKRDGVFTPSTVRMDQCDDPNNPYVIAMLEVPGMKADQLSVRIENNTLIVEGERTGPHLHTQTHHEQRTINPSSEPRADAHVPESAENATLYPVRELKYGKFRRNIRLPPGVNANHVRSTLVEGMLTVSWPRDPSTIGGETEGHDRSHAT